MTLIRPRVVFNLDSALDFPNKSAPYGGFGECPPVEKGVQGNPPPPGKNQAIFHEFLNNRVLNNFGSRMKLYEQRNSTKVFK